MGTIITLHDGLAGTSWMFFFIVGIWGTVRAIRGNGLDGSYLGALAIGQGLLVVQAILGGILWFGLGTGRLDRPSIHLLYGIFAILFLPFVYFVMLRSDDSNRGQWVMAFCALFLFGIALRAMTTALGYAG